MKYLLLVGSEGLAAPQEMAAQPGDPRLGRGDGAPRRAAARPAAGAPADGGHRARARRRDAGERRPFAEAKEWIAGFDLVECADLDEAIEVAAKGPVSWFKTIEIRPVADGPWLGEGAAAFGRGEDGPASPYLLAVWTDRTPAAPPGDQAVMPQVKAWRQDLQARGLHILGAELEGADTATTLRVRSGRRCSATGRSSRPGSSSPASTSSAALTATRPSSSPPRTQPPATTRSRYARSRTDDTPAAQRAPGTAFRNERDRPVPRCAVLSEILPRSGRSLTGG